MHIDKLELVGMHIRIFGIARFFLPTNTHDIELLLVKVGKKLKVAFSHFERRLLVQNVRFSGQH